MDIVKIRLDELKKKKITIGKMAENMCTGVLFDCAEVFGEYPDALPALTVISPKGQSYPATVTKSGSSVLWEIKDSDLTAKGNGELQLAFVQDEVIKRSYVGRFTVLRSITSSGEAPDPIEEWETEAGAKLAEVDQALEAIPQTISTALAEAKASGEFDGPPGQNGQDGAPGADGYSPTVEVEDITGGHRVTITDAEGAHPFDVMDGEGGGADIDDDAGEGDTDVVWSADKSARTAATLSSAIAPLTPVATSGDVGKFLKAKTVSDGKVTEYEFGSGSGGGGAEIDDTAGHGDTTVVWSAGKTYDEIEKVKPGDYRLLKEVIISGDDTKVVMVDTDTNGDPFIVHEMMIDFEMAACSGTSQALVMPNQTTELWTSADLIPYLAVQNLFSSSKSQRRTARLKVEGGRFFGESEASSFDNHYGSVNSQRSRNATGIYECDPISAVRIWSINGHYFGDGTKIKIYGR